MTEEREVEELAENLMRQDNLWEVEGVSNETYDKYRKLAEDILKTKMSKKIYIASRGTGKVDKDGKITDYTLLSYDLVTPPKRTFFRRIFDFFKKLWNFIKPKQRR